ncbi:MAG: prolipoprotein diacylglyceryl transferase [Candidatus Dasytiphilus stammeri]
MNNKYLLHPNFSPIILHIGFVVINWYGLMYLISFFVAMLCGLRSPSNKEEYSQEEIKLLFYVGFIGLVIGGRIGYVFFYNLPIFLKNPEYLFQIWHGGMSFHGGLLGVIIVIKWFAQKTNRSFLQISDFIAPLIPFGLGAGRLANFINGELWGRVTIHLPWAMIFPHSYYDDINFLKLHPEYQSIFKYWKALPRHPSQLYEFFLEGVLLFIILNIYIYKQRSIGRVSGLFLLIYGIMRFIVEFFRQPDIQLGLFYNIISMGQILSIPMILTGIVLYILPYKERI